jgi:hypothetical protein
MKAKSRKILKKIDIPTFFLVSVFCFKMFSLLVKISDDENRVKLHKTLGDEHRSTDYINASYVQVKFISKNLKCI